MIYKELKKEQLLLDTVILHNAGVTREDTIVDRLYAIHFEIMEVFNENGFFKYWKKKPSDQVLPEYVDCIHFALSLGIDFDLDIQYHSPEVLEIVNMIKALNKGDDFVIKASYLDLQRLHLEILEKSRRADDITKLTKVVKSYLKYVMVLGHLLDITEEEVINNYFDKNEINYKRVKNNY